MALLLLIYYTIVGWTAGGLAYLYFLLLVGRPSSESRCQHEHSKIRYAIAIPAHNEVTVIGDTVKQLRRLSYPKDMYDIHVVADHCTDDTAEVAKAAGVIVHVRECEPCGRKGFALTWLVARLLADERHYDIVCVFDADSLVDETFLLSASKLLASGAEVIQGHHVISNPRNDRFSALADADMRLNNRIRNQAKENLGFSARLMGDAMCFRREILEAYPWGGQDSLTEDRDYGIDLVTRGVKIRYTPDAVSYGQAAGSWKDATSQRARWYAGASTLRKKYLGALCRQELRSRKGMHWIRCWNSHCHRIHGLHCCPSCF